ncbi:MAG TPA: TolC family protein [Elusimicrobiota bacterium]|nr:TolC family protein [Elusimicrobiota bacterium]
MNKTAAALGLALLAAPALGEPLTLADCLSRAEDSSVQYSQARLQSEQAAQAAREARALLLPQVTAQGTYDKSDDQATQLPDANKAVVHADQPLTPFSGEWTAARQRVLERTAAEREQLQALRDVQRRVRQLYFGILQARAAIASSDEVRGQLEKLLNAVLPRYTMGRAPSFDVVKVRAALSDLEKARADQQARLVGQSAELAQTLALDATAPLELSAPTSEPPVPGDEQVVASLLANPGLQALTDRARAARVAIQAARWSRLPQLVGSAEYGWTGQTAPEATLGWDLALSVRLPLIDWGAVSARVRQRRSAEGLAKAGYEVERQTLVSQALESRVRAENDLATAHRLRRLLPDTKQAAAAEVDRYRRGAATILEATEGINLWLGMSLDERAAYYSYLSDLADLSWAGGRAPGDDGL